MMKVGGGSLATGLAVVLCFAFWPQVKRERISSKPSVEQPVFMVSAAPKPATKLPVLTATASPSPLDAEKVGFDKLASALKTNVSLKTTATPTSSANPDAAQICARGLIALARGDIAAARLWLARAADAGDPRALVALGDAYNPAMLARLGVLGAPGDPAMARSYYNRAVAAGLIGAKERLASLSSGAD
jgi:TPR repeat protein